MIKDIKNKNLILFGCGAVQLSVLELIDNYFTYDPKNIRIIDFSDKCLEFPLVQKLLQAGAKFILLDINKHYKQIISELNPFDIVIDLTYETCSLKIIEECKKQNVHYINTSIEEDPKEIKLTKDNFHTSYKYSHNEIQRINREYPNNKASCVLEMGMNPGAVSFMAMTAILFLGQNTKFDDVEKQKQLDLFLENRQFNFLCQLLEIELVLCTEYDTGTLKKIEKGIFYNDWCTHAFYEESFLNNCEFCYGSYQKKIPKNAEMLDDNIIDLKMPSSTIFTEAYCHDQKIIGQCIPHGENISLCSFFRNQDYSPSCYYCYKYSPVCFETLRNIKKNTYEKDLNKSHVISNFKNPDFEQVDKVGALVCSKNKSVWCGSILSNKDIKYSSATTQQVSCSVLSALTCLLENPNEDVKFPESLSLNRMMELMSPFMGKIWCNFVPFHPPSLQFNDLRRTKKQFDSQFK